MTRQTIGFIGGGNMARSLAKGLLANGWGRDYLLISDFDPDARQRLQEVLDVETSESNIDVASRADIVVLAVKPQVLKSVAEEIAEVIQEKQPLVISIAAGVRTGDLRNWLGGKVTLVRAMPNTPALVGSGATGLYAAGEVSSDMRDQAETILRAVGVVVWVNNEELMDVVTALSGSGPAYFLLAMEALEAAAIEQGLDADTARLLTLETAFGAAKMALEDGEEPTRLRERVTSPGGTTEKAINTLEENKVRESFRKALIAATERSRELADLLGKG
jgi:pyrroline-5-carboxylate reductase